MQSIIFHRNNGKIQNHDKFFMKHTKLEVITWKMSKYGVFSGRYFPYSDWIRRFTDFSGPYFPAFSPNTGKYGPEKTLYLNTFHTVSILTHYIPVLLIYTPWKHQKTFKFSDVFRGYRKATPDCNGLIFNLFDSKK